MAGETLIRWMGKGRSEPLCRCRVRQGRGRTFNPKEFAMLIRTLALPLVLLMLAGFLACGGGDGHGRAATDDAAAADDVVTAPTDALVAVDCTLPNDVTLTDPANPNQADFDAYSWQTFIALNCTTSGTISTTGDNDTTWETWSTTDDLFDTTDDLPVFGTTFVPTACQSQYQDGMKILDQANKADDLFEEAFDTGALIDQNGNFGRFEVVTNEDMFEYIVSNGLYTEAGQATFANSGQTMQFTCGSTSTGTPGALMLKAAWKILGEGDDASTFHVDDALVYTPGLYSQAGQQADCSGDDCDQYDVCTQEQIGLVGLHFVHKTEQQWPWIWSTFEQVDNVPDCNSDGTCPSTGATSFFNAGCTTCAACNTKPTGNSTDGTAFWLDQPATQASQICRRMPIDGTEAATANATYQPTLGTGVWSHYQLVGTQWYNSISSDCGTTTGSDFDSTLVVSDYSGNTDNPNGMGNATMESYDSKPNCMTCHVSASDSAKTTSDFVWFLGQEFGTGSNPPG